MTAPDDALNEIRRLNHETKKLLAEVAANQEKLTEQLNTLDRVIVERARRGLRRDNTSN